MVGGNIWDANLDALVVELLSGLDGWHQVGIAREQDGCVVGILGRESHEVDGDQHIDTFFTERAPVIALEPTQM